MSDLISRQDAIDEVVETFHAVVKKENEYITAIVTAIVTGIESLPSAQKTGHWIDKSRGDQKNSECSECHTLFRVLIHDYPYCPVCGSRNRGDEE